MDWAGWALFGLAATAALTSLLIGAQLAGWTRLDPPCCWTPCSPRIPTTPGRSVSASTSPSGSSSLCSTRSGSPSWGPPRGGSAALFGLLHTGVALTALIPLFAGVNPRISSTHAGLETRTVLQAPGLFALNYGYQTPLVAVLAHLAYGGVLGLLLGPR
jgi:hypothetical protein